MSFPTPSFARQNPPAALAGFAVLRRVEPSPRLVEQRQPLLRQRREPQQLSLFGPQRVGR